MRPTPLLRQIAANTTRLPRSVPKSSLPRSPKPSQSTQSATAQQPKLPLPNLLSSSTTRRLRRPDQDFLPSTINAPTTIPPHFVIPKDDQHPRRGVLDFSTGKLIYYKAKAYLVFYKTGLKQFNQNRKHRKKLKQQLMTQMGNIMIPGSAVVELCRSEFQMLVRTKRDWRKMPCKPPVPFHYFLKSPFSASLH